MHILPMSFMCSAAQLLWTPTTKPCLYNSIHHRPHISHLCVFARGGAGGSDEYNNNNTAAPHCGCSASVAPTPSCQWYVLLTLATSVHIHPPCHQQPTAYVRASRNLFPSAHQDVSGIAGRCKPAGCRCRHPQLPRLHHSTCQVPQVLRSHTQQRGPC